MSIRVKSKWIFPPISTHTCNLHSCFNKWVDQCRMWIPTTYLHAFSLKLNRFPLVKTKEEKRGSVPQVNLLCVEYSELWMQWIGWGFPEVSSIVVLWENSQFTYRLKETAKVQLQYTTKASLLALLQKQQCQYFPEHKAF